MTNGRTEVARSAPRVASVLDRLERTAWNGADPELLHLTAVAVAAPHGLRPPVGPADAPTGGPTDTTAAHWTSLHLDERRRAALRFAEQFSVDVAAMGEEVRAGLGAHLGAAAFDYAQTVYVFDVVGRARAILDALFGGSPRHPPGEPPAAYPSVWAGIEELLAAVPGLSTLDPVTTEVTRLRLARHHRCRLCRSLRSRSALAEGADEATFDAAQADSPEGFDAASLAALELVDAFAWTPGRIAPGTLEEVRRHFSTAQQVELVLDAARNAANKLAVAFAADEPHVESGVEIFDVSPDGTVTYGLEAPISRRGP